MRQVPEAPCYADTDPSTSRDLRNLHRSCRRLLACPSSAPLLPYLGLVIGRKVYAAGTMPFGLNMAPRVFTKIPKTVVQQLRLQGLQVAASLDDWLIRAQYPAECLSAARKVITFLQSKGFQFKFRRSRRTPLQTFAWLGLLWNLSALSHCLRTRNWRLQVSEDPLIAQCVDEASMGTGDGVSLVCLYHRPASMGQTQ